MMLIFLLRVSGPEPGIDDRLFALDLQGEEICLSLKINVQIQQRTIGENKRGKYHDNMRKNLVKTTGKVSGTGHSQGEQEYQYRENAVSLSVSSFAFCYNNGKNDTVKRADEIDNRNGL